MNITKLYTDMLDSIVQAQYKAYVFSEKIGEQVKDNLFPIPIAEIKEITLDVHYAYLKDDTDRPAETEIIWALFYKNTEPVLKQVTENFRKRMIAEIDIQSSAGEAWRNIRQNLTRGTLDAYVLSLFEEKFYDHEGQIVRNNIVNLSFLVQLLADHLDETMLHNAELEKYTQALNLSSSLKEAVEYGLRQKREELQTGFEGSLRKKRKELDIIIDANELKSLPPEAIQRARVVLDIRTILNEKEQQP